MSYQPDSTSNYALLWEPSKLVCISQVFNNKKAKNFCYKSKIKLSCVEMITVGLLP